MPIQCALEYAHHIPNWFGYASGFQLSEADWSIGERSASYFAGTILMLVFC